MCLSTYCCSLEKKLKVIDKSGVPVARYGRKWRSSWLTLAGSATLSAIVTFWRAVPLFLKYCFYKQARITVINARQSCNATTGNRRASYHMITGLVYTGRLPQSNPHFYNLGNLAKNKLLIKREKKKMSLNISFKYKYYLTYAKGWMLVATRQHYFLVLFEFKVNKNLIP